jgi:putative methylase
LIDTKKMLSKKQLSIVLSELKPFSNADPSLEQYSTDSELASGMLWQAKMQGDIEDKEVADLGCGSGVLGIGALLLGAKKVNFLDLDDNALEIAKENLSNVEKKFDLTFNVEFLSKDVDNYDQIVDTVIQNPPFGIQNQNADRKFYDAAMRTSRVIYTIHKESSEKFIRSLSKGWSISNAFHGEITLNNNMKFHTKSKKMIKVCWWRLSK